MKTEITQDITLKTTTEGFGPRLDKYGYERGYRVTFRERVYALTESGAYWSTIEPGTWFDLVLQNIRRRAGGQWETYQASTIVRGKLATLDAAEAYAAKVVSAARKRLEKA